MHTPTPSAVVGTSDPTSPMRGRILLWAITSSLAGFLFGFDTVVISGAEQKIQALWGLSAGLHGVAMASALYGTVLGSLVGGWPTDRFGRRATLLGIGVLYIISAVGCGLAPEVWSFIAARFLGGVGIGISTVVAPVTNEFNQVVAAVSVTIPSQRIEPQDLPGVVQEVQHAAAQLSQRVSHIDPTFQAHTRAHPAAPQSRSINRIAA
jgi:hypothetical protein